MAFEVSNDGHEYSRSGASYQYDADAVVHGVEPSIGPESGGVLVTVKGMHFRRAGGCGRKLGELEYDALCCACTFCGEHDCGGEQQRHHV